MTGNCLLRISQDERECAIFRSRRKFETDYASDIATAEDRGKAIGKEEGVAKRNKEIAQKMLKIGEPISKIMLITDLTQQEIEALQN